MAEKITDMKSARKSHAGEWTSVSSSGSTASKPLDS